MKTIIIILSLKQELMRVYFLLIICLFFFFLLKKTATNLYQTASLPVKRTALTDSKTGMPMFHPFTQNHSNQATTLHHFNQHHAQGQPITIAQHPSGAATVAALNYPAINFAAMQYAPYPPTFSLPC